MEGVNFFSSVFYSTNQQIKKVEECQSIPNVLIDLTSQCEH